MKILNKVKNTSKYSHQIHYIMIIYRICSKKVKCMSHWLHLIFCILMLTLITTFALCIVFFFVTTETNINVWSGDDDNKGEVYLTKTDIMMARIVIVLAFFFTLT